MKSCITILERLWSRIAIPRSVMMVLRTPSLRHPIVPALIAAMACSALADPAKAPTSTATDRLTGYRFLTLNTVVRVRQIEATRDAA